MAESSSTQESFLSKPIKSKIILLQEPLNCSRLGFSAVPSIWMKCLPSHNSNWFQPGLDCKRLFSKFLVLHYLELPSPGGTLVLNLDGDTKCGFPYI